MNKSSESKTGIAGEGYVDVFIDSLCSPKSTYHRGWAQRPGGQCDSSININQLCSRPLWCQGALRVPGTLELWLPLGYFELLRSAKQQAEKGTTVSEGHSVLTNTLAASHLAQPSATGQTRGWGKGDFLHRIWLKGTSRDRLTYPRNLCLNYNYKLGDMPEMTWRLEKSKGCG